MAVIKCCKGCTDRHEGCHSTCERYIAEKANVHREYDRTKWEAEEYYRGQWKRIRRRINSRTKG